MFYGGALFLKALIFACNISPMSSTATPISAQRFAQAIKELPFANLVFKESEIRNSIAHLLSSNQDLQPSADKGDSDCADAIQENLVVIQRMEKRIVLLKAEVEERGFKWTEDERRHENLESKGHAGAEEGKGESRATHTEPNTRSSSGQIKDEEVTGGFNEQVPEIDGVEVQDGLHL